MSGTLYFMSDRLGARVCRECVDVLADVVTALRTGLPSFGRADVRAPWGLRLAQSTGATFHLVLHGTCWLLPPGGERPHALGPGDAVLLPRGVPRAIADQPTTPPVDVELKAHGKLGLPPGVDPAGGQGARSLLLCGTYRLDRERPHPLLNTLPDVMHLPVGPGRHRTLHTSITLLGEEIDADPPGSRAVVPSLVDAVLVLILRAWLEEQSHYPAGGWSRAMTDTAVARSLALIHAQPGASWTAAPLDRVFDPPRRDASRAAASPEIVMGLEAERAALAQRFRSRLDLLVGVAGPGRRRIGSR
jgi:hypothetical protein